MQLLPNTFPQYKDETKILIRYENTGDMAWVGVNQRASTTESALCLGGTKVLEIQVHRERCVVSYSIWFKAWSTGIDRCAITESSVAATPIYIRLQFRICHFLALATHHTPLFSTASELFLSVEVTDTVDTRNMKKSVIDRNIVLMTILACSLDDG